jgi:hypothetical protein
MSGYGKAESTIDAMLDRVQDRLGHRRERSRPNRFRRRNLGDLENRLHNFRLGNGVDGFGVSRFDAFHLLELIMEGFWMRSPVIGPLIRTEEGFQCFHRVFDLLLTKLKAIKFPSDFVELRLRNVERRQVILAIDL